MEKKATDMYIPAFYAGRSIFITGGTGFLGKALIEKLLRSCSDVKEIFVLIRPKKGQSVNDRLKKMLDNMLFDLLRSKQPSSFDKIIPIAGNVAAENLGLEPSDREMLIDRVSMIFHIAASVKFDDALKDAIFINTRSTRDICVLAEKMKKLVALLHVSSTYTQCDKHIVEEILYPSKFNWKEAIKIAETVDEGIFKILSAKYLDTMPNTYVFSKRLAEDVISDYSETLPCVIIRPSIVIASSDEPVKGWMDNFNGPMGMLVAGGKGLVRVLFSDPCSNSDFMPVDAATKVSFEQVFKITLIAGDYENYISNISQKIYLSCKSPVEPTPSNDKTIDVYNCSSNQLRTVDIRTVVRVGHELTKSIPLENVMWKPQTIITKSSFVYYVLVLLLHIIPAILLDAVIKLFGARPLFLKLQRKVYVANSALSFFLLNDFKFYNAKLQTIVDELNEANQIDFGYRWKEIDIFKYFKNGLIGAKIYLLNESMDNLKAAKHHSKRMEWLDFIFKTLLIMIVLWILYRKNTFYYILDTFAFI